MLPGDMLAFSPTLARSRVNRSQDNNRFCPSCLVTKPGVALTQITTTKFQENHKWQFSDCAKPCYSLVVEKKGPPCSGNAYSVCWSSSSVLRVNWQSALGRITATQRCGVWHSHGVFKCKPII